MTGVAARIAQQNAYQDFINENLGIGGDKPAVLKRDRKQKAYEETVEQDTYI